LELLFSRIDLDLFLPESFSHAGRFSEKLGLCTGFTPLKVKFNGNVFFYLVYSGTLTFLAYSQNLVIL